MINQEDDLQLKTSHRRIKFSQYNNVQKSFGQDKNNFYILTNVHSMLSIRQQIRKKRYQNDIQRIMGTLTDQNNVNQLWMIIPFGHRKYQIVHFKTDDAIQTENQQVRLGRAKLKPSQLFEIENVDIRKSKRKAGDDFEFVKIKNIDGYYLSLQGILSLSKLKDNKEEEDIQIFIKRKVNNIPDKLKETAFIVDPIDVKQCFDLSGGSKSVDNQVVLANINCRANQRWIFQPSIDEDIEDQNYVIKNYLSGLYLDVSVDGKLIQTSQTQKIWQIRKQHQFSGQLFCTKVKKYLDKGEDNKLIFKSDLGKRWKIIVGRY